MTGAAGRTATSTTEHEAEQRAARGRGGLRVARIAGIDISVDPTWLIAFALITWSLASSYYPSMLPERDALEHWVLGAVSALALFGSVLLHELSHSLVARAKGLRVRGIRLFVFGGVSEIETEAERPGDEFLIAVVGPLSSLVIAAIAYGASVVVAGGTYVSAILGYLATVNLIVGIFNLLPGFPLDGGRVLRAGIWAWTGSLRRAQRFASYAGQAVGLLLIFLGINQLFAGNLLGGVWIAFIGWFLNSAAETSRREHEMQEGLRGITVSAVMDPTPPITDGRLSVREFVFERALREGERALLVVEDGRLVGIVTATDVKDLDPALWGERTVAEIMTRVPLRTASPDMDLASAVRELASDSFHQLPVVRDGRPVGILGRDDVVRALALRDELGLDLTGRTGMRRAA